MRQPSNRDIDAQKKRDLAMKRFAKKVAEKRKKSQKAQTVTPVVPVPQTRPDGSVQVGPVTGSSHPGGTSQRAVGASVEGARQGAVSVTHPPGQPDEGVTVRAAGPAAAQRREGASVTPAGKGGSGGVLLAASGSGNQRSELRAVGKVEPKPAKAKATEQPQEDVEEPQDGDEAVEAPMPSEAKAADPEATETAETA